MEKIRAGARREEKSRDGSIGKSRVEQRRVREEQKGRREEQSGVEHGRMPCPAAFSCKTQTS